MAAEIGDAWSIRFAQGGIVMATLLHAAGMVLARDELEMVSATGTFPRPVPCGPVLVDVEVLRSGTNAAQVQASLRNVGDDDPTANAVVTVVMTRKVDGWPEERGLVRPPGLEAPPDEQGLRMGDPGDGVPVPGFFRQTEWREAPIEPPQPLRRLAWFSMADPALRPDGTWVPAMLAVPGDALGLAAVPTVSEVMGPLTAPSLQISMQWCGAARGRWLGIDSVCHQTHGAISAGVTTLWNADGSLVASVTQTALLRRVPPR